METTERTYTDEQVKAARSALNFSRSAFYRDHDKEEMLDIFELLTGEHGDIDDLGAINKTKLTDAIQTLADQMVDTNMAEASLASAAKSLAEWPQQIFDSVTALEAKLQEAGQAIANKPFHQTTTWKIESLLDMHVEIQVRAQIRSAFFVTEDKGVTWTRREGEDEPTLESVRENLLDDILRDARNVANKSSGAMRNVEQDMELEHRTKIHEDLNRVLRRAAEKGLI